MTHKSNKPKALYLSLPSYRTKARTDARKSTSKPRKSRSRAIRRRSVSMTARMKAYNVLKEQFINYHVFCAFPNCMDVCVEVHHRAGRRGKLLLWEAGWIGLCSRHHRHVHNHPKEARELGLLAPIGQFNNQSLVTP